MNGKLIVIEGADGSGKTTQFNQLKNHLEAENIKVETTHFPRHETPFFGIMVDQYLDGEFGDPTKLNPKLASLLYAMDRWEARPRIEHWLEKGLVLLDRYTTSNQGHQLSKLNDDNEAGDQFLDWLDELEYNVLKIPKPDLVIFLDVPVKFIKELLAKRGGQPDLHEKNLSYLEATQKAYRYVAEKYDYWRRIDCVENNKLLPIETIHNKIWKIIKAML